MHAGVCDFAAGASCKEAVLPKHSVGPDCFGSQCEAVIGNNQHGCLVANARIVNGG